MVHPLKITSTMADETRYRIYEHMLKEKKTFSVQQIAELFDIHPNVARHHLTKLAEINVISADYLKTGKGGRPGRVYKINEDGVSLSFPKQEEPLLLNWLIEAAAKADDSFMTIAKSVAFEQGQNSIKQMGPNIDRLNKEQKIKLLEEQAALIGYVVQAIDSDQSDEPTFKFHVYNCPFHKQIQNNALVICALHENYIKGQISVLFPNNECLQVQSMISGCAECLYVIK